MQLACMCVLVSQVASNLWKCSGLNIYIAKIFFKATVACFWAVKYYRTVTGEYKADLKSLRITESDLSWISGVKCRSFYQKSLNHNKINFTVELCLLCSNSSGCTVKSVMYYYIIIKLSFCGTVT